MHASIWPGTLASFCEEVAGSNPAPAAVAASAVTASLGLSLLIKVLEITGRRKSFAGDAHRVRALIEGAHRALADLKRAADDDIQAVRLYVGSKDPAGARDAIDVPLRAARAACAGLDLCVEGADVPGVTSGLPAADFCAAVYMLSTAVRAILLSVTFNLRQFDGDVSYRAAVEVEGRDLAARSARQTEAALKAALS
jgi:formiminotetrahydrofolate cyclodeaminase